MEIGRQILFAEFGSHVYGTNIPTSDRDYKAIIIPTAKDILMQKAGVTSFQKNTKEKKYAKNTEKDVDIEYLTLTGFIRLCSEGQTMTLDLLFTPKKHWKEFGHEWLEIVHNRDKLIHKGTAAFFGYAQQQAAKYGLKGSYIAALKEVLKVLSEFDPHDRLVLYEEKIRNLAKSIENVEIVPIIHPKTGKTFEYLKVRNCKVEFNATVKYAVDIYKRLLDRYGERARAAETNEGVDWKACMHAVRVCNEAIELLKTGFVTFPRPEKDLLLQIRKGELSYKRVADMIEEGLENLESAKDQSSLPDKIDLDLWNRWSMSSYAEQVITTPGIIWR